MRRTLGSRIIPLTDSLVGLPCVGCGSSCRKGTVALTIARKWIFPILWIVIFAAIAAALVKLAFIPDQVAADGPELPSAEIVEPQVPVTIGTIRNDVVLDGTIAADAAVPIPATLSGEVREVVVGQGQWVDAGQEILKLRAMVTYTDGTHGHRVGGRHRSGGRHALELHGPRRPAVRGRRCRRPDRAARIPRDGQHPARAALPSDRAPGGGAGHHQRRPGTVRVHRPDHLHAAAGHGFRQWQRRHRRHRWNGRDGTHGAMRGAGRRDRVRGPHGGDRDRRRRRRGRAHGAHHRGGGNGGHRQRLLRAAGRHARRSGR